MSDVPDLEDAPLKRPVGGSTDDSGAAHVTSIPLPSSSSERTLMDEMMEEAVRANKEKQAAKQKQVEAQTASFGTGLSGGFFSPKQTTPAPTPAPVPTPVEKRCDNPTCRKYEREVKALGGKFSKCGRCKVVWYCGVDCQRQHWNAGHKTHCGNPTEVLEVKRPTNTPSSTPTSGLVLPDVQKAMSEGIAGMSNKLSDGKWMTPDFLTKISENPRLLRAISDPRMTPFLEEMQKNPAAAMARMKAEPELEAVFRDFCELMGTHLSTFEESASTEGSSTSTTTKKK